MTQSTRNPLVPEELYLATFTPSPDPTAPKRLERFRKTIHWLWETETQAKFLWRGVEIAEWSTYSDYYGFMTSVTSGANAARNAADSMKPEGNAVIVAETTLTLKPVLLASTDEFDQRHGRVAYEPITSAWYAGDDEVFDKIATFDWNADREDSDWAPWQHALENREIGPVVVWSSNNAPTTPEQQETAFFNSVPGAKAIRERFAKGVKV